MVLSLHPKRGPFHLASKLAAALLVLGLGSAVLSLPARAEERRVEKRVAPTYPELAKKMHVGGVVKLLVTIAADGSVVSAKAQSGNLMLVPAAEQAAKRWKFAAGDGQATEVIDVQFEAGN